MKMLSALALAAALGLAGFSSADAHTMKKPAHHAAAHKSELVCHKVKEKDGKMHTLCHHHHAHKAAHHAKKVTKKAKK